MMIFVTCSGTRYNTMHYVRPGIFLALQIKKAIRLAKVFATCSIHLLWPKG